MSIAVRLGLFYAALLIGTGASAPYAGLWFRAHGLSGAAIGLILAAPSFGRMVTGPAIAFWADGFALRRTPIALIAIAVAVAYAALAVSRGFWAWMGLWFISQSLFGVCSPLADVITLRRARTDGFNYGWPRGIGSAAYILGNVAMGLILGLTSPDAMLVWIVAAAGAAGPRRDGCCRRTRCMRAASDRLAGIGSRVWARSWSTRCSCWRSSRPG